MLNDGDKFERNGHWFRLTIEVDEGHRAPWLDEDGHGHVEQRPVVRINGRDKKRAGERVLAKYYDETTFYNFAETVKLALADGWGWLPGKLTTEQTASNKWKASAGSFVAYADDLNRAISDLHAVHRASMSPKAYAAGAAEADYKRMKAWADDEWHYVGVIVTLLDVDNETPRPLYRESLWGIESDSGDHIEETAHELADEILARMGE